MQLRQAETLRVFHHHHGGIGNVHADLDYSGGDQDLDGSSLELPHHLVFLVRIHAAVKQADLHAGERAGTQLAVHLNCGLEFVFLVFFDYRIDDVGLPSRVDLFADVAPDFLLALIGDAAGDDGSAAGGQLVEHGNVEIAVEGEGKRARDGSRGHDQNVRLGRVLRRALLHEREAL